MPYAPEATDKTISPLFSLSMSILRNQHSVQSSPKPLALPHPGKPAKIVFALPVQNQAHLYQEPIFALGATPPFVSVPCTASFFPLHGQPFFSPYLYAFCNMLQAWRQGVYPKSNPHQRTRPIWLVVKFRTWPTRGRQSGTCTSFPVHTELSEVRACRAEPGIQGHDWDAGRDTVHGEAHVEPAQPAGTEGGS